MQYQWRWGVLFESPYLQWLISGLGWTVLITLCAWVIAFPMGVLAGSLRTTRSKTLRTISACYVEFFRGIPLLVQLFLWFFVVPEVLPERAGMWLKRELPYPEFFSAVLCLGLYTSSRVSEQVRSGISTISGGVREAAISTGLSELQTQRLLLIPLGLRMAVPPLTSEFLALLKNSSVALTIGLLELTAEARRIENYTFQAFEAFAAATTVYLLCSLVVLGAARRIESSLTVPGFIVTR